MSSTTSHCPTYLLTIKEIGGWDISRDSAIIENWRILDCKTQAQLS